MNNFGNRIREQRFLSRIYPDGKTTKYTKHTKKQDRNHCGSAEVGITKP
jgi:hypothetical protein